ncbi:MAG: phosphonopyruvate decarboxylase [Kiritimatiellae bacterium]|nr:phosphonopyruvate decarboxylase [Kiritimatiellia bacterium]
MISCPELLSCLESAGVDLFVGVPDSLLKNFCACLADTRPEAHVITANEGGAVALAAGHWLATRHPALVYMQNSGQGNAVNPLASLADPDVYSIPMLLLVGWRGEPGVKDEPQHVKQGKITLSLFETLGIPISVLPDDEPVALSIAADAVRRAVAESRPVALVVRKGLFAPHALQNKPADIADLRREDAIEGILRALPPSAVVVSTTGMISREVYETRERHGESHARDFLTVGSMGHALMIALGIAKAQPARPVVCLDGDGASIMQMGNLAIAGQSGCSNLFHIVLNNAAHDSVGGQPTVGGAISLPAIAAACGYRLAPSLDVLFAPSPSPSFLEIRVAKGARSDLGRPKEPPQTNKALFMETLSK